MLHIGFLVFLPYIYTYTTRFLYLYPQQTSQIKWHLSIAAILQGNHPHMVEIFIWATIENSLNKDILLVSIGQFQGCSITGLIKPTVFRIFEAHLTA